MFISIYQDTCPSNPWKKHPSKPWPRQNHRLRSLWLPMISTSIWEPPVPNVIEAVFILASRLHVFVVRFFRIQRTSCFFCFRATCCTVFWFLVWQKETDINDAMPGHGSTKPKYKSNYVVCLATSFFTNSICILLQKIAICHLCVFLSKEFLHPKCAS